MANFILDDLKSIVQARNPLHRVILYTTIIFLVQRLIQDFVPVVEWLALPGNIGTYITRPWTLVTYMFLHGSFTHWFFNMLVLYIFGRIMLEFQGSRRFVAVYFMSGIAGGLFFLVAYGLMVVTDSNLMGSWLLGASAGVTGVMVAITFLVPNYPVRLLLFGEVPIKYIALVLFITSTVMDFSINTGGKLAHIGGAVMGYVFIRNLQRGTDLTLTFNSVIDRFMGLFTKRRRMRVVKNDGRAQRRTPPRQRAAEPDAGFDQKRVDSILDKILQSGYDSLTEEEKEFLFKSSNKK
ncbi:rhomboid family intramembrane serine protease [bacterium SCSIO 12741]|nr:rhomboid family intramembrane serine protease [bacterium SCSIO 12741]